MFSVLRHSATAWTLALISVAQFTSASVGASDHQPRLGAVSSENAVCSQIGINLLKAGGNAADAMVGTVICVGVVAMAHSGIGGGGFMIIRSSNGSYEYIDFREMAGQAAFEEMYTNNTEASLYGGLATGVPGELRGLEYLHKNYGVLPWATVLSPAIHLARHGFSVNEDQVRYMNTVLPNGNFLTQDPSWAIDFAPKGYLVKLNETMTRKRYADTLETIASEGADAFYSGAIANATVSAIQRSNGTLTVVDLKNYTVASRKPSEITYRGYKIRSCGTPAGGSVTLSALNIMNGYTDFQNPDLGATNLSTHRLIEAMRFAYGQRTELGDPSFLDGIDAFQEAMLSDSTAKEIRLRISDLNTNNISWYDPQGLEILETPGTSHITAADKSGLAISLTTTINTLFGSQVMVPETGIILNNEMNDFSIPGSSNFFGYIPSPANFVRPGKRPLSSMSPTIVETADGKFYLAIGSAGGSRIITATIQNIHHILDLNRTTAEALSQPRVHDQLNPSVSTFEWGYDNNTVAYIKAIGHNVSWVGPGQSTAQALRLLPNGTFEAAGEPRQLASGGYAI